MLLKKKKKLWSEKIYDWQWILKNDDQTGAK